MKIIDLNKTVFELVNEYPEIQDILAEIGFKEIKNNLMLKSVGKFMTIPRGAVVKKIDLEFIKNRLREKGFEIKEYEVPDSEKERTEKLEGYIKRLNEGEDLNSVREDFKNSFKDVSSAEIMKVEQELLLKGLPQQEVQRLCDVHSALFHGCTANEKENKLDEINEKGHPIYNFHKENIAIEKAIDEAIEVLKNKKYDKVDIEALRKIGVHYSKKGDLIYPLLKVKYNTPGPSEVMWGVDDEIKRGLKNLSEQSRDDKWSDRLYAILNRAKEMIYKEENILFPVTLEHFSEDEWIKIYHDMKEYSGGIVENESWDKAEENNDSEEINLSEGYIELPEGRFKVNELRALLNTMPYEITFVDANDLNAYFNDNGNEKLFKRPNMAIGRDVYSCHPPRVEPMVREIISKFRNGEKDDLGIWADKAGITCYVLYMAVRDKKGEFLGTLEIVQDMTFAKEHFLK